MHCCTPAVCRPVCATTRVRRTRLGPGESCYVERVPEIAERWIDEEDLTIGDVLTDLSWIDEIRSRKAMKLACAEHGVTYETTAKLSVGREALKAKLGKSTRSRSK